jgi:hypothetical protein
MARQLTQYRVFIASPGGLDKERKCFRTTLIKFTSLNAEPRCVVFHPVGWEDTLGGVGPAQERINENIKRCDYAVFVLHDRWGSPSGDGDTSRTEAELALAEELYKANKIRKIVLFFKKVNPRQMRDPGEQLKGVIAFKPQIEEEERYLITEYTNTTQFSEFLEAHLAQWLKDHEDVESTLGHNGFVTGGIVPSAGGSPAVTPDFNYWITEAMTLLAAPAPDYANILFCARKATAAAMSIIEWAQGGNITGIALFHLGKPDEAIATFSAITERFVGPTDQDHG